MSETNSTADLDDYINFFHESKIETCFLKGARCHISRISHCTLADCVLGACAIIGTKVVNCTIDEKDEDEDEEGESSEEEGCDENESLGGDGLDSTDGFEKVEIQEVPEVKAEAELKEEEGKE
ncbi:uncharacterized protein LY89DRAFT_668203 [Mollisia scopiformis]|uniref:Uncharacterized protein n=1 Tax=Mollisia scopiformis TaxID=149040 RepID=A0A194XCV4_MOLSC|nr:uncharacterized protein LY89DRAFT_668203 [Mollisia scopiformis]KUJ18005.1 hypothetical protein LY89DRAFT_668203 [Mollisia scopiformis]